MQTEQIETALKLITAHEKDAIERTRRTAGYDGISTVLYAHILMKYEKEQDPEYQAYLALQKQMKAKYGDQV